jgi:hypothetical protein
VLIHGGCGPSPEHTELSDLVVFDSGLVCPVCACVRSM